MNHDDYKAATKKAVTDFGEFAYAETGEGPPAVFVHGLFVSGFLWARQTFEGLASERRCIAYNLPHHGGSTVPDDQPLTLEANAEMLAAFCDALDLKEPFDLVANDTGGAVAQAFTVAHPERVRTLTLTNCEARDVLPSSDPPAKLVSDLAEKGELAPLLKASYDDLEGARKGAFASTYERPDTFSDDDIHGLIEPHQATVEAARHIERFMTQLDSQQLLALEPALKRLETPTLCVWGTGDTIFPLDLAHWLRDTIPGCDEVVEVEGGKLFWPFERGDELVEPLKRFWAGHREALASR